MNRPKPMLHLLVSLYFVTSLSCLWHSAAKEACLFLKMVHFFKKKINIQKEWGTVVFSKSYQKLEQGCAYIGDYFQLQAGATEWLICVFLLVLFKQ